MNPARGQRLTLAGSITGAVIVALDGSVLTVVQPVLQRELHASVTQVQWTSTGYLIAVASLLVFAGRLGDHYGHKRIFATGVLGFAVTSAAIGLAESIGPVIGLRIAQGVFGALLQPATLGMLRAAYPPGRLAMPIALRTSAIGVAVAAGPILGGALAAHMGWRSVFFLSVVPAIAAGVLALYVPIPETRRPGPGLRGLNLPGAFLLAATLGCLVHTLVGLPDSGWTPVSSLAAAAAVTAGSAFVLHERRTANPLVPPAVLRSVPVISALAVLVSASASLFGVLFLGTYLLQDVLGLDPFTTALHMLPMAVMMVLGAPASAVLQRRLGYRATTMTGMLLLALGILLVSRLDEASGFGPVSLCFLVMGAGFAPVMVTATAVIVHQASVNTAGVSGGLQQTAMNIGPALGVAATTMLMGLATPGTAGVGGSGAAFVQAMGPTLVVLAALGVAGAAMAVGLPGRDRQPARSGCRAARAQTGMRYRTGRESSSGPPSAR
ncbi:MFS transporter [Streptomyces sp. NPDC058685]|uniref:MFS transporter n=1 Tax=Streptomyces sp. NPDC058685 TaxID=3346598 RepID=UPI003648AC54